MYLENLLCFGEKINLYSQIMTWENENPNEKLYVWGTGSVAAGVVKECEKHNIRIDGLFVNVNEYNVDERIDIIKFPIFQLQEIIDGGKNFSVIVGHAHYEYVEDIKSIPQIKEIWTLTSIVREDIGISEKFIKQNICQFQKTYEALSDDKSKKNMVAYLNAKITGKAQYIIDVFDKTSTYFNNDVLMINGKETYLDLGAYDGKSIQEFINMCPSYNKIIAVEVQPKMAQFLCDKYKGNVRITIKNLGISDHIGVDYFNFDDQSTCLAKNGTAVNVSTVDKLCEQVDKIDIIKICVGNSVVPLLNGAKEVLHKYKPKLIISAGVDKRALLDYISLINELVGNSYNYYLRFTNAMSEAMVMYAMPSL